jgi:predicted PurR-regulated permease PerM
MAANRNLGAPESRSWPFPQISQRILLSFGIALVFLSLYPFFGSLSVAAVFAYGLYPYVQKLVRRFGKRRPNLVVSLSVLALTLIMILPITFFSVRIYHMASPRDASSNGLFSSQTLTKISAAKEKLENSLVIFGVKAQIFLSEVEARESIQNGSKSIMTSILAVFPAMFASVPDIFLGLLVFCLFLYLFLSQAQRIRALFIKLGIVAEADIDRISKVMQASCYNSLISNLIIGVVQATVVVVGARIAGYSESVLIFSLVFVMSFVPVLGSLPLAIVLAGISLLNHNAGSAVILLVTIIIAGIIDSIIRPNLVASGENAVHPILSFAVIIGAIAILGLKGIFLGPVILTATVGLLNLKPSVTNENQAV